MTTIVDGSRDPASWLKTRDTKAMLVACQGRVIIYLIGTLLVVAGLAYAASRMGISSVWIMAGALVIIGLGLMGGIVKTRQKDPAI
jgi:hypothetical protein